MATYLLPWGWHCCLLQIRGQRAVDAGCRDPGRAVGVVWAHPNQVMTSPSGRTPCFSVAMGDGCGELRGLLELVLAHWTPSCCSCLRSQYQLEYAEAQAIMEGTAPPRAPGQAAVAPADLPALQRSLRFLARLAGAPAAAGIACLPAWMWFSTFSLGAGCQEALLGPTGCHAGWCSSQQPKLPAVRQGPPPTWTCPVVVLCAASRRQQRLDGGAMELESAELRFRTDASGKPTDVLVKQASPGGRWQPARRSHVINAMWHSVEHPHDMWHSVEHPRVACCQPSLSLLPVSPRGCCDLLCPPFVVFSCLCRSCR